MKSLSDFKTSFKTAKNSSNPLLKTAAGTVSWLMGGLRTTKRFLTDADHRSIKLLQWFKPQQIHQTTTLTFPDRYPKIFAACRDYFGDRPDLKILSFGCSTGEEVVSLRQYLPAATIVGAEINAAALAQCRRREVDARIEFIQSEPAAIQARGPYDAIFCMAVLQRTPHLIVEQGIADLGPIYPFEKFEKQVEELDALLQVGGLLIVHFTQYFVLDTSVGPRYEALQGAEQDSDDFPKFDRNSQRSDRPNSQGSIFAKRK